MDGITPEEIPMHLKLVLAAAALAAAPALANAACNGDKHTVMSCADGLVYDSATRACVPASS